MKLISGAFIGCIDFNIGLISVWRCPKIIGFGKDTHPVNFWVRGNDAVERPAVFSRHRLIYKVRCFQMRGNIAANIAQKLSLGEVFDCNTSPDERRGIACKQMRGNIGAKHLAQLPWVGGRVECGRRMSVGPIEAGSDGFGQRPKAEPGTEQQVPTRAHRLNKGRRPSLNRLSKILEINNQKSKINQSPKTQSLASQQS